MPHLPAQQTAYAAGARSVAHQKQEVSGRRDAARSFALALRLIQRETLVLAEFPTRQPRISPLCSAALPKKMQPFCTPPPDHVFVSARGQISDDRPSVFTLKVESFSRPAFQFNLGPCNSRQKSVCVRIGCLLGGFEGCDELEKRECTYSRLDSSESLSLSRSLDSFISR